MTAGKRAMDLILAILLSGLLAAPFLLLLVILLFTEGRPFFYVSERMQTPDRAFRLVKLRTMRPDPADRGVTGGDKLARMSRVHRFVRKIRADEIPQLWNVIRGDISLVGPRPPLRLYVEAFPELYGQVLRSRPGITGLATLRFHRREEAILAQSRSPAETDLLYRTRCIPRKARLDLIYQQRRNLCWDIALVAETAASPFRKRRQDHEA